MKRYSKRITSPIEEADTYVRLLALREETGKPKYSIRSLAMAAGKNKSYIADLLLFARVTDDVRALIEQKPNIPPRIVRELQKLATPEERAPLITAIHEGDLRVADVRAIVKERTRAYPAPPSSPLDEVRASHKVKRRLKRDHDTIMSILEWYQQQVDHMSKEEKALLNTYLSQWAEALDRLLEGLQ